MKWSDSDSMENNRNNIYNYTNAPFFIDELGFI